LWDDCYLVDRHLVDRHLVDRLPDGRCLVVRCRVARLKGDCYRGDHHLDDHSPDGRCLDVRYRGDRLWADRLRAVSCRVARLWGDRCRVDLDLGPPWVRADCLAEAADPSFLRSELRGRDLRMDRPEGLHRRADLCEEHALVPGDPIRLSLDPSDRGVGFVEPRRLPSKQGRRSCWTLGGNRAPTFFLRNPTCCSNPTFWTMDGSLANCDLANLSIRELGVRRTWVQPGSRAVRVENRRRRQRGSLERPMSSGAWTFRAAP
jgi:hypothetical protein